jgi:glycerol-3-phosphate dehydrogenase
VLKELGRSRILDTKLLPIGGGLDFPESADALVRRTVSRHNITFSRAEWLVGLYGTGVDDVLTFCLARPDDVPLDKQLEVTVAEVAYLAQHERIVTLGDLVLRRLPLAITGLVSEARLEALASILSTELNWGAEETRSQVLSVKNELHHYHGVSADMLSRRDTARTTHARQHQG